MVVPTTGHWAGGGQRDQPHLSHTWAAGCSAHEGQWQQSSCPGMTVFHMLHMLLWVFETFAVFLQKYEC